MKISKEEKINRIKNWITFPNRVAYYIAKDLKTGNYTVIASPIKDKKKELRNVKFREVEIVVFGNATAPLGIHDVEDAESVIELTEYYKEMWDMKEGDTEEAE